MLVYGDFNVFSFECCVGVTFWQQLAVKFRFEEDIRIKVFTFPPVTSSGRLKFDSLIIA